MSKPEYFISVDVGGTNCRIGLLEVNGQEKPKILQIKKFLIYKDYKLGIQELVVAIKEIQHSKKLIGVSTSFPGIIDFEKGEIFEAHNLANWEKKPLQKKLQQELDVPVLLLHDVSAALVGEAFYGQGKGLQKFVFLIWGTGFGGAKFENINGKIKVDSFEVGHQILERNGELCLCGQYGCAETWLGGGQLGHKMGKKLSELSDTDPIWDKVAEVAAQAVINTQMFHPTPLIVFGGGLILKRPFLLEKVRLLVAKEQKVFLPLELKLTSLGDDAALYGGVALQKVEMI